MRRKFVYFSLVILLLSFFIGVYAKNEDIINLWVEENYVYGIDGDLALNQKLTRAQFVSFVNRRFGFEDISNVSFSDITKDAWYFKEVSRGVAKNYISGFNDNTFRPSNLVTDLEIASFLSRLYQSEKYEKPLFEAPKWCINAYSAAINTGILPENDFHGVYYVTRLEAIQAIEKAYELSKEKESSDCEEVDELFDCDGNYEESNDQTKDNFTKEERNNDTEDEKESSDNSNHNSSNDEENKKNEEQEEDVQEDFEENEDETDKPSEGDSSEVDDRENLDNDEDFGHDNDGDNENQIKHFTVTYLDINQTTLFEKVVEKGEAVSPPCPPIEKGYKFSNWSEEANYVVNDLIIYPNYIKLDDKIRILLSETKDKFSEDFYRIDDNSLFGIQTIVFNKNDLPDYLQLADSFHLIQFNLTNEFTQNVFDENIYYLNISELIPIDTIENYIFEIIFN